MESINPTALHKSMQLAQIKTKLHNENQNKQSDDCLFYEGIFNSFRFFDI